MVKKIPLPTEDLSHVLTHTRACWEQLCGKRIFVTGGTGFFGAWLLESFIHANDQLGLGAELVALSRNPAAFVARMPHLAKHPALKFHQGDVRDFEFPEGKFSHVIHAGTTSSAPVESLEMLDTIVQGTKRTLDFAMASGAKRFLFVSSGAVYGEQQSGFGLISENRDTDLSLTESTSAYGEGKRRAELLCTRYHQEQGLETTVARCFAFVGPHLPLDAHFAIGNFIKAALEKKPLVIKSNGTSERSYLYAADLAIWLWTILFEGEPSRPYNVGSENTVTIKKLAEQVHQTLQLQQPIQIGDGGVSTSYIPDTARARQELGLKERVTIEESIQKYFDWIVVQGQ